jgi:hypothetical protein
MLVQDAVQSARFVLVAIDAILDVLGRVASEVIWQANVSDPAPLKPSSFRRSEAKAIPCPISHPCSSSLHTSCSIGASPAPSPRPARRLRVGPRDDEDDGASAGGKSKHVEIEDGTNLLACPCMGPTPAFMKKSQSSNRGTAIVSKGPDRGQEQHVRCSYGHAKHPEYSLCHVSASLHYGPGTLQ